MYQRQGRLRVWLQDALVKKAKSLRVGNGVHKDTDVGPLISPEAKERAVRLITGGIHQARPLRFALQLAALGTKRAYCCAHRAVMCTHLKALSCKQLGLA